MISPRHTPGVYTTPVAFISAVVLDWSIIVEVSDSQKQSINDASQYVTVPPICPEGVGMNDAKLIIYSDITLLFSVFLEKSNNLEVSRIFLYLYRDYQTFILTFYKYKMISGSSYVIALRFFNEDRLCPENNW